MRKNCNLLVKALIWNHKKNLACVWECVCVWGGYMSVCLFVYMGIYVVYEFFYVTQIIVIFLF